VEKDPGCQKGFGGGGARALPGKRGSLHPLEGGGRGPSCEDSRMTGFPFLLKGELWSPSLWVSDLKGKESKTGAVD